MNKEQDEQCIVSAFELKTASTCDVYTKEVSQVKEVGYSLARYRCVIWRPFTHAAQHVVLRDSHPANEMHVTVELAVSLGDEACHVHLHRMYAPIIRVSTGRPGLHIRKLLCEA